jgi:formylglycine-generating enzyme required for sulfatase activity
MLDKGSADQVLLGEHWEEALPEWLGSSRALNQNTQVLVVVPKATDAERAVGQMVKHPGPWAVVVSEDVARVARALDFAGIRAVEQVAAPWRVHRAQGQVFVSGGPERKEDAGIEWVHVCPGTFTMGRLPGEDTIVEQEQEAKRREWSQREIVEPQRTVVLSAFQMAATETTQQQYGETGTFPKADINWADARAYCRKIDADLPTEAQWEYAARGGSRFPWSFGDAEGLLKDYAWFKENSSDKAHEVRQKQPNPLELYDMYGNVWEWVLDWYGDYGSGLFIDPSGPSSGDGRVVRGGSFFDPPVRLRSAVRVGDQPELRFRVFGFRCVRVPPALAP